MVLAMAAFMSLGTTGAMAAGKAGGKPTGCKHGKGKEGKCKPKPKPRDCDYGKDISGKCKPKPPECPYGMDKDGKCLPKPPIIVEPPKEGACSEADLVLLEDLLKGTGGLLCVYLGDNAPNATADADCPDALIALPIDNLLGACVFLPPVDIADESPEATPDSSSSSSSTAASTSNVKAVEEATGTNSLQGVFSLLTGLLKLGSS
jgi:hypothetical protein